tara:strand:+ start:6446 stop:7501 length:1056 start_codon:yes stop_codon:yes gene_type:complete
MYQGREGFEWFTGIVEDRNDPLFLNRVRVRIHGAHSHDKQMIATPDLPWCEVLMPVTSPSLSGLGTTTHGLIEGSFVMGFYRDAQTNMDPVIIGSFVGTSSKFSRIDETIDDKGTRTYTKIDRKTTDGFNDPRLEEAEYSKGDPDGDKPKHINRNYGLTLDLKNSPRRDGSDKGVLYPKETYYNTSSVNLLARATDHEKENSAPVKDAYPIIELSTGEGDGKRDDSTYLKPKYPFNHVHETESGHVLELDDTPDYERIHLYHRKGTRVEIDKDGNYVEKVVKDKYSVVLGNETITVSGDVTINVEGNCNITAKGKSKITATEAVDIVSMASTTVTAVKDVVMNAIDKVKIQ